MRPGLKTGHSVWHEADLSGSRLQGTDFSLALLKGVKLAEALLPLEITP